MAGFHSSPIRQRQRHAKLPVLIIHQPSLSPPFGEFDDAMRRVVDPNALVYGIAEDRAEQCHGAPGDTTTAAYDRETAWLGLLPDLPSCRQRHRA